MEGFCWTEWHQTGRMCKPCEFWTFYCAVRSCLHVWNLHVLARSHYSGWGNTEDLGGGSVQVLGWGWWLGRRQCTVASQALAAYLLLWWLLQG